VLLVRHADPDTFLAAARPVLDRDEAEAVHFVSRTRALAAHPPAGGTRVYLATVGRPARGLAFLTGEGSVLLGFSDGAAAASVAEDLAVRFPALPGVVGGRDACDGFVARWRERTGREHALRFHLRHHALSSTRPVNRPAGSPRVADEGDIDWLVESQIAFLAEARVPDPPERQAARVERGVARGAYWIWDDGARVAYAGWHEATSTTARVGPVYTPPAARRRGYATALTAALSQALLERGWRKLFLSTDLANATSNAIYARVGYRPLSEIWHYDFVDPAHD
jgi:RimJ/RimL family protein N-acetyltransferase